MQQFTARHRDRMIGVLEGWYRLLFRGTMRGLSDVDGLRSFLNSHGVLLKHFAGFAARCTAALEAHAKAVARRWGRPYEYLPSSQERKDARDLRMAREQHLEEELICVLSCVEPCMSFDVRQDKKARTQELVLRQRKCRFFYF